MQLLLSSQVKKVPHFSYLGNATCCDTQDSQKGGPLLLGVTANAGEAEWEAHLPLRIIRYVLPGSCSLLAGRGRCSNTSTVKPRFASSMAVTAPAGPAPMTTACLPAPQQALLSWWSSSLVGWSSTEPWTALPALTGCRIGLTGVVVRGRHSFPGCVACKCGLHGLVQ